MDIPFIVRFETEEELNSILKECENRSYRWISGDAPLNFVPTFSQAEYLYVSYGGRLTYGHLNPRGFPEYNDWEILSAGEFLYKEDFVSSISLEEVLQL